MVIKLRRMRRYTPRKRRTKLEMQRQHLLDKQHHISAILGRYLVLLREGNREQTSLVQHQLRSELLKTGPEMQQLSSRMSQHLQNILRQYLESSSALAHANELCIDPALIHQYHNWEQALRKELHAAA